MQEELLCLAVGCSGEDGNHLAGDSQLVQVIGPPLHHGAALIQIPGMVGVGSTYTVTLHVGQLALDSIRIEAVLFRPSHAV